MSHIRSNMSNADKATALGDGNMGAMTVCLQLGSIDPYYFQLLDTLDITGEAIYMLFTDVCGRDIDKTGVLLIACDSGLEGLTRDKLMHAINNRGAGIDVQAIVNKALEIANTNDATRSLFRSPRSKNLHNN